jgi:hypothetical protein
MLLKQTTNQLVKTELKLQIQMPMAVNKNAVNLKTKFTAFLYIQIIFQTWMYYEQVHVCLDISRS